jgi:hypothetical protein
MLKFPNCCFEHERGTEDWPSFFEKHSRLLTRDDKSGVSQPVLDDKGEMMKRMPPFDKFGGKHGNEPGKYEGGIMTDGKTLYVYGYRPKSKQQRTKERTTADLKKNKDKIREEFNACPLKPRSFWIDAKHTCKGKLGTKVVRPFGKDNFTGIVKLEDFYEAMGRDTDLLEGRVNGFCDSGEKYPFAGHASANGLRFQSFRFSSRSLFQQTGRDKKEKEGRRARDFVVEEFGDFGYLNQFERQERAHPSERDDVQVDMARLAQDLPAMMKQNELRRNARWDVHLKQEDCFEEILKTIVARIETAQRVTKATKQPILFLGDKYGPSKGARGARGHITTPLVKYLAQFLLIVLVPEHNTTKLCPLCHRETQFANKHQEIRSKVCKSCPVAGKDFFYDRDYGAASNIQYKAEFFVRSGGLYPAEFITIEQHRERRELFDRLRSKIPAANQEKQAAVVGGREIDQDANSASDLKSQ